MKKSIVFTVMFCLLLFGMMGCNNRADNNDSDTIENESSTESEDKILVGFSQLGAESDWRSANTVSMKETFATDPKYQLIFEDGQQKQANQITAIRKFIQQEVDYIVLAPVTEEGWDTVLEEAKEAGIPVILVDRMISVSDETLFSCYVGSDFKLEGDKLTQWLLQFMQIKGISSEEIHLVNIQGSLQSSAQLGRTKALQEAVKKNDWDLLEETSGEFTETKAREVMTALLKKYENINVVYCENDNMAFGAIAAIEQAGKTVGSDIANGEIMVLAFDGVSEKAIQYVREGKITCIAECNPHHGPRVHSLISTLNVGGTPKKISYVNEGIMTADDTVKTIEVDGITYDVNLLEPD